MLGVDTLTNIVDTMIGTIGSVIAAGLTLVLGIIASLIALLWVLRFIYKKIGRAK